MIRILMFLLGVVFFAFVITYFASLDSRITGEAFGYHFDGPSGLIVGAVFVVFLAAIYLTHKIKDILSIPAKIRAKDAQTKRERGVAALTRGLEAVAIGDGEDAAHHARVARRNLEDVALTRLLTAQAAQLSGDQIAAKESFSAMLAAPETEFLGLKGLYAQAMAAGDIDMAKGYAERAFRLRPNAKWAFQSVFDLGLERGAWRETRDVVAQASKNKIIDGVRADRAQAALLAADAYAAGDKAAALADAEAALKLSPGFTPAAVLAARLAMEDGKTGKAAKFVESAFADTAHPALIKIYDRLYKDDTPEKRADKLRKLADNNAAADEAALLRARAATLVKDYAGAVAALEPLLSRRPSPAAFSLMAKAAAGLNGEAAAQQWLEHAANAPRDPRPGADGEFHLTREGWARMIREFMEFARLSPPPIEHAASGISPEEMRLLLTPPVVDAENPKTVAGDAEGGSATAPEKHPSKDDMTSPNPARVESSRLSSGDDDHIHNDEEAERAAAAAREVS